MAGLNVMKQHVRKAKHVRVYVAVTIHDGHWVSISKNSAIELLNNTIGPDQPITDVKFGFDENTKTLRIG